MVSRAAGEAGRPVLSHTPSGVLLPRVSAAGDSDERAQDVALGSTASSSQGCAHSAFL